MALRLVSWVRPDRISSPMISTAAVTRSGSRSRLSFPGCSCARLRRPFRVGRRCNSRNRWRAACSSAATSASSPTSCSTTATEVTAHCPNPGAMLGLNTPGLPAWLSPPTSPSASWPRPWSWSRSTARLVGVNTLLPNRIVAEALAEGADPRTGRLSTCTGARWTSATPAGSTSCCWPPSGRPASSRSRTVTCGAATGWPSSPTASPARGLRHLRELTREVARRRCAR